MIKKDFIQRVLIRSLPELDKADDRIVYAEHLWSKLDARGYGNGVKTGPQDSVDYYSQLAGAQKGYFNRFWSAYGYKQGKSGAAMRWSQIFPSPELAERIIAAAKKENEAERNGAARKMAQGWLQERRWEDIAVQKAPQANQAKESNSKAELQDAKAMYDRFKDTDSDLAQYWLGKVGELESLN